MSEARHTLNAEEIAAETISGEAVILNLSSGVYYSVDGAGGMAWTLLARGHTTAEVGERLASHFDGVDSQRANGDVEHLLARLLELGLLEPSADAQPGELTAEEMPVAGAYSEPKLQEFSEMGELLALDPPMPGLKEVPWRASGD